jgi:hypothetical protein
MSLSQQEKDLIFDFYFKRLDQAEAAIAASLVAVDPGAAKFYHNLQSSLASLGTIKEDKCPDDLAERTVAKLKLAASAGKAKLDVLLAAEQGKIATQTKPDTTRPRFWRALELTAAAAMFLVVASSFFVWNQGVQQAKYKTVCASNMRKIGAAMAGYAKDNDNKLPAVATIAGSPWWKVGDQGKENHSNTRHNWLLVKGGYAKAEHFICPARRHAKAVKLSLEQLQRYNDFPSRRNVSYSFALMGDGFLKRQRAGMADVLMSDRNPVFENAFDCRKKRSSAQDKFVQVFINENKLRMMSANHRGQGQNVLLRGGSASFKNKRLILNDDIFTVQGIDCYMGSETTTNDSDMFLVP